MDITCGWVISIFVYINVPVSNTILYISLAHQEVVIM